MKPNRKRDPTFLGGFGFTPVKAKSTIKLVSK